TTVIHTATIEPNGSWGAMISRLGSMGTARVVKRAYGEIGKWAQSGELPALEGAQDKGAKEQARILLTERALPVAQRFGLEELYERLVAHLLHQPSDEIASLAPYMLADAWRFDREQVLRFFLHATREGAFDLQYNLICPSCRQAKVVFSALVDVPAEGHCPSCNIDFGVDFDRSVEVRFSPAPLGLESEPVAYCHAGPQRTPHRLTSWVLAAHETREVHTQLAPGTYYLSSLQCKGAVYFEVMVEADVDAAAKPVALHLSQEGISGMPAQLAGAMTLILKNQQELGVQVHVVRAQWADNAASAAQVTAMQEFRDLFGSEILAPGAEFSLRNLTFLFSDLVGSTALYEQIGDAVAFAVVRDHFALLKEIYLRHHGSLVKTIGDAVMAVFRSPVDALEAALEMHQRIGTLEVRGGLPLALRIGLHRGPCIAMEANGVVDYFGTTVNLAARVQGQAGPAEVALSPSMLEDAAVRQRVEGAAFSVSRRAVTLKGLAGEYELQVISTSEYLAPKG
ncbi:MAG: adenylate/guanylate cyclase domain-containing protein, partial [Deltaproteobacteria bacterium]|nr:adenylate/guanylate cyclase domain-containing protein [Deltaproteobacteria bacterium]